MWFFLLFFFHLALLSELLKIVYFSISFLCIIVYCLKKDLECCLGQMLPLEEKIPGHVTVSRTQHMHVWAKHNGQILESYLTDDFVDTIHFLFPYECAERKHVSPLLGTKVFIISCVFFLLSAKSQVRTSEAHLCNSSGNDLQTRSKEVLLSLHSH